MINRRYSLISISSTDTEYIEEKPKRKRYLYIVCVACSKKKIITKIHDANNKICNDCYFIYSVIKNLYDP